MAWIIIVPIVVLVSLFLVIWFVLAKNGWFFAFTKEATAKAVMKAEEFDRIIFRWKGHFIDEDDNIWEEEDWGAADKSGFREGKVGTEFSGKKVKEQKMRGRILGGLFWIGLPPVNTIHKYPLRWSDFRQVEEGGKAVFKLQQHDEPDRDFVMLKPAVYGIEVEEAETRPPERIEPNLKVPVLMRVINPRKFLFIAPPTPLEDVLIKISALIRQRIGMSTLDELITLQGQAETIWEGWDLSEEAKKVLPIQRVLGMKDEKLIKETLPNFGLMVAEKGIDIKNITPPPDIKQAMVEKRKQDFEAAGRAEKIRGTVISAVVRSTGKDEKEVQDEYSKDPGEFNEKHKGIREDTMNTVLAENGAYFRTEALGNTGLSGEIIPLIGAIKNMLPGLLDKGSTRASTETGKATEKPEENKPAKSILATLPSSLPRTLTKEEMAEINKEIDTLPKKDKDQWLSWIAFQTGKGRLKTEK